MYVIIPLVSTKRNFPPQLLASPRTDYHGGLGRSCSTEEIFWGQRDKRYLLTAAFFGEPGVHRPRVLAQVFRGRPRDANTYCSQGLRWGRAAVQLRALHHTLPAAPHKTGPSWPLPPGLRRTPLFLRATFSGESPRRASWAPGNVSA